MKGTAVIGGITYTAVEYGEVDIAIQHVVAGLNTALSTEYLNGALTVNLATDAGGLPVSTAADVIAAVAASGAATVVVASGTGTPVAASYSYLVGGGFVVTSTSADVATIIAATTAANALVTAASVSTVGAASKTYLGYGHSQVFSFQTGELYTLVFPIDDHSEAVVYDFRIAAWGGRHVYGFLATCASTHLGNGESAIPTLGTATGVIREFDGYTDLSAAYLFECDSRTIDGARPTKDKVFNDSHCGITVGAEASVTVSVMCEHEVSARAGATKTVTLAAGEHSVRNRITNARATSAFYRVSSMSSCAIDVWSMGVDLFFCRTRP